MGVKTNNARLTQLVENLDSQDKMNWELLTLPLQSFLIEEAGFLAVESVLKLLGEIIQKRQFLLKNQNSVSFLTTLNQTKNELLLSQQSPILQFHFRNLSYSEIYSIATGIHQRFPGKIRSLTPKKETPDASNVFKVLEIELHFDF